jgi:hypothetical protein
MWGGLKRLPAQPPIMPSTITVASSGDPLLWDCGDAANQSAFCLQRVASADYADDKERWVGQGAERVHHEGEVSSINAVPR